MDSTALQNLVSNVVSVVHHHNSGRNAEGIGTIVPLFPLGSNVVAATARNQLAAINLQITAKHIFQRFLQFPDGIFPSCSALYLKNTKRLQNLRVNQKLIPVNLSKHRI